MNAPSPLIDAAYERYAACVRALHRLFVDGKGDGDEADALRDRMDEPWEALTSEQQALASGLTADLNWIRREPARPREPREAVLAELEAARKHEDWRAALEILRRAAPYLPRPAVAYRRGVAWEALGDPESARLFFEHEAASEMERPAPKSIPTWARRDRVQIPKLPRLEGVAA